MESDVSQNILGCQMDVFNPGRVKCGMARSWWLITFMSNCSLYFEKRILVAGVVF